MSPTGIDIFTFRLSLIAVIAVLFWVRMASYHCIPDNVSYERLLDLCHHRCNRAYNLKSTCMFDSHYIYSVGGTKINRLCRSSPMQERYDRVETYQTSALTMSSVKEAFPEPGETIQAFAEPWTILALEQVILPMSVGNRKKKESSSKTCDGYCTRTRRIGGGNVVRHSQLFPFAFFLIRVALHLRVQRLTVSVWERRGRIADKGKSLIVVSVVDMGLTFEWFRRLWRR